jgi:hypothetical protein
MITIIRLNLLDACVLRMLMKNVLKSRGYSLSPKGLKICHLSLTQTSKIVMESMRGAIGTAQRCLSFHDVRALGRHLGIEGDVVSPLLGDFVLVENRPNRTLA